MKVNVDNTPTTNGKKFGFVTLDGCAMRIGFRFTSVDACIKYAAKHDLEIVTIY